MEQLELLSDDELIASLKRVRAEERSCQVSLLKHLNEMDRRSLAEKRSFGSLFVYCMRELGYSEGETRRRVHVARKAAKFKVIYLLLEQGAVSMTALALVAPHLDQSNHQELLGAIRGKTSREVEFMLAERFPQREQRESVRPLAAPQPPPAEQPAPEPGQPEQPSDAPRPFLEPYPSVKPFAPDRVRFEFNGSRDLYDKIERAKQLLRHKYPFCTLEQLFGESLESLLEDWDPVRRMARKRPSSAQPKPSDPTARVIPQHVKDEVYRRDGGCCTYVGEDGKRCQEKSGLEYDHIRPHALGGLSIADNLRLLCEGHNRFEAERRFGEWAGGRRALPGGDLPLF